MTVRSLVMVLALVGSLAACSGSGVSGSFAPVRTGPSASANTGPAISAACDSAMAAAAAIGDMEDTNEDLDPAIKACKTLAEFAAAALKHPKALDGVDPATYLGNRCDDSDLASTALCASL